MVTLHAPDVFVLTSCSKPVIGAIRGVALGGGSELVMNLDINVAGQTATFGFPEVKRGVSINAGGLPRFVRLVGHQKGEHAAANLWRQC